MVRLKNFPYFDDEVDSSHYEIKSALIDACIEGGDINGIRIISYTVFDDYQYAQYVLTSIAKFAFNIKRRIGYEETIYLPKNGGLDGKLESTLSLCKSLTDEQVDEAVSDLQRVKKHVFNMLEKNTLIDADGTVPVYRTLNSTELAQILHDIENGSLDNPNYDYTIQTNILVSGEYEHEHLKGTYAHRTMKVCFHIPAEDILFHPDFILTSCDLSYSNTLCIEKEIIFLNKHPKGWMNFKTSDIFSINEQELELFIKRHKERKREYESRRAIDNQLISLRFLNENDYYLLMDAKFISIYEKLTYLLNILTPRLQRKVKKQISKQYRR
ncbi:hypothetical protein ACFVSS_24795 [Peribacillus butanolivorans]|uniref:hypothetical protein n=1 Tax=Peribacillus butanolivorans TaxID=421767 RepID=UPI0036DC058B